MDAIASNWLTVVVWFATTAILWLTAWHYFLRLQHPERPMIDDFTDFSYRPKTSFKLLETVRSLSALFVTCLSLFLGLEAMLYWLPADYRIPITITAAFIGGLLLLTGIDKLARKSRSNVL